MAIDLLAIIVKAKMAPSLAVDGMSINSCLRAAVYSKLRKLNALFYY